MIRRCNDSELNVIYEIINDAAIAYKGVIPEDRFKEPYMPRNELIHEMAAGVRFWCYQDAKNIVGIMGIQDVLDVTLIRHAYVRTACRSKGVGGKLLKHLRELTDKPILMGTWAEADWAIKFYQKHGYNLVSTEEKIKLLKKYWTIPDRQIETSVVLADNKWFAESGVC